MPLAPTKQARVRPLSSYVAQVLHLYENFTYAAHPPMIHDYQLSTALFEVKLSTALFEVKPGEQGLPARHAAAAVPPCSRGRWVLGEEYRCYPA